MLFFHLFNPVIQNAMPDWTQMAAVLAWLAGPVGAVMAVNWLMGNYLEKVVWWDKLPKWVKWVSPPIFAIILAIAVQQVIGIPGLAEVIQPYWSLVVSIVLGYFASQKAYMETKRLNALTENSDKG